MKEIVLKVVAYIIGIYAILTKGNGCGPSEYQSSEGECCPMCGVGLAVYRDCTAFSSTSCIPCVKGKFMDSPSGLHECFSCKTCDTGLYILHECTTISNTVCDVMDGYYCEVFNGECSQVLQHSKCKPGQKIKIPGTKSSDTVCENCPEGFYSPEGDICHQWTDCSVKDQVKDKDGSSEKDVQCKDKARGRYGFIAVSFCILIFLLFILFLNKLQRSQNDTNGGPKELMCPVEETVACRSLPEENQEEGNHNT